MTILRITLSTIFIASMALGTLQAETLQWSPMQQLPPGVEIAMVQGDPTLPEPFVLRLKLPPRYIMPAHSHTTIEYEKVISGQYYAGLGKVADGNKGKPLSPGDTITIPANTKHYGFTQTASVIEISGMGPWKMDYE
jgi:quercetin dioxygenase-like cupin family protein